MKIFFKNLLIMKKTILALFALAISLTAVNAQQAFETTGKLDKKTSGSCVSIKVNSPLKDAQKTLETLLKNEGLKGKTGKIFTFEKVVFPAISTDYINLYASFEATSKDKNNPITTVNVFVSKGISSDFINSGTDQLLISNLRAFLDQKFVGAIYNNFVANKVEEKNKEIKETANTLDALQKEIDKKTKDISTNEKNIEKANANIEQNKKDIETAKKNIEAQKAILQQQQQELKDIK